MPRCRDCEEFQKIFGGRIGGGKDCSKDTMPDRKTIHALDYTCKNYKRGKE